MTELATLPSAVAAVVAVALNAYVLLGGADFGGGVWDLLASGPRRRAQRELVAHAIGPIWEANHVWLILVIVLLFTCFPPAFADLSIRLHIPLTLMLIGIVLRGSAFAFRAYGRHDDAAEQRWGLTFAVASAVTPVLLGVTLGAIASGGLAAPPRGGFVDQFVAPWLTPFALAVGVFALILFAFLAAVYLTLEAKEQALREDFRLRALASAIAVFLAAFGVLLLSHGAAPLVRQGLTTSPWAIPLHALTGLAALAAIAGLWSRRYRVARVAAAAQVSLILWGWVLAQYPYLLPERITIAQAAAPPVTLQLVLGALGVGALALFPSLYYLFRVFKMEGGGARQA
jgi:cytochrome d ubiquinol oxidase subunit II